MAVKDRLLKINDLDLIRKVIACYEFYNIQYAKSERIPGYLYLL